MVYSASVLPLDCGLDFDPARDEDFFAAMPPRSAVFLLEPHDANARPFLSRTADLRRRLERLLRAPEAASKRLNLRAIAARVRYRVTGSPFEQAFVLYHHARQIHPRRYREFLRLRPPALLKLNLRNEYPRCYVTRRILADAALYVGPFPSRKFAEEFSQEFLNLFKIRRCQIKIRRDPAFPGCIYSEMKMCLAPCFAGCSKEEYDAEVVRVADFLCTSGDSLRVEFEREREASSESLNFEHAAALHKKVEKVNGILRGFPELPGKIDSLDAIILQPSAEEDGVAIFTVRSGRIADPFVLRFGELQLALSKREGSQPRSLEEILREHLSPALPGNAPATLDSSSESPSAPAESLQSLHRPITQSYDPPVPPSHVAKHEIPTTHALEDHLSLLARWFYGKPRIGEIFFPQPARGSSGKPDWPYRRIIRACSRILTPPAASQS